MLLLQMVLNASGLRFNFPWNSRPFQSDSPPKLMLPAIEPRISFRHPGALICLLPWAWSLSLCPPSSFGQNGLLPPLLAQPSQILPFSLSKCLSSSREQPPVARPPVQLCPLFPSRLSQLHTGHSSWTDLWLVLCFSKQIRKKYAYLWNYGFFVAFIFFNFYWNIADL